MKKFMLGFLFGALLFASVGVFAAEYVINPNPFPIVIDGVQQQVEAYNINGFTFLKLADVGKVFNKTVKFNESVPQIEISQTGSDIVMQPGPAVSIPEPNAEQKSEYSVTTYNNMGAIEHNGNIYLAIGDTYKTYKCAMSYDKSQGILKLSKNGKIQNVDTNDINNAIIYSGRLYLNKTVLDKFAGE